MSFPGSKISDHLADSEVERRIQEELRLRQQNKNILNASRAYAASGSAPGPSSAADHAIMNLMATDGHGAAGAAAYYAAQHRAAYGGGLGQPTAFGMDSMYARQAAQHQQHAHAAAAAAYGYAPRGAATSHYGSYGHHAAPPDLYSQHILEQRAAAQAYGSVSQQQQQQQQQQQHQQHAAAAHQQLLAASSPQPKMTPSSGASVAASPPGATIPSAESTPLQAHLQTSPTLSEIAPKSSPPASMTGIGVSPMGIPSTPMTTPSSVVPSPRTTSTKKGKKSKKIPHETTELEDLKIEKWYSGCVPLGLDDDKYWLSELQVYLRANFGEFPTTGRIFAPAGFNEVWRLNRFRPTWCVS